MESNESSGSQESGARGSRDVHEVCSEKYSAALEKSSELGDSERGSWEGRETSGLVSTHAELGDANIVEAAACSTSKFEQPSMDSGMIVKKDDMNSAGKEGRAESKLLLATKQAVKGLQDDAVGMGQQEDYGAWTEHKLAMLGKKMKALRDEK